MMPPFELPSQFSEDPLEEPSFAQVAGAPTLGSGVSSLVDVSTSGSEVCSVVRAADSVVDWVVVVASVVVASTLTEVEGSVEVVVGAADVVSVVRGADGSGFGSSEVEGSADGSDVVDVVVGVVTSTLTEVEGSTEVVDGATEVVSVVRVVDSTEGSTETEVEAEAEGSSEVEVGSEDASVEVGVSDVVGVVDEGDVVKLVEELGVGSFASSSSRFSCASLTRKKVRSRSACASLMSGG